MIKRLFFLSVMMSAVGVPYAMSTSSGWWSSFKSRFASSSGSNPSATDAAYGGGNSAGSFNGALTLPGGKQPPIEGYGKYELAEVLHFEATPAWVTQRWPRVTVGLAEPGLQGYRVPLITGTAADDVAGSLTYYFDNNQRAKMLHLRGTTGNPSKVIALATQRFGMKPQPSGDPSLMLYQVKWNGKPVSELRIRTAGIVRASEPRTHYQVELAVKRQ